MKRRQTSITFKLESESQIVSHLIHSFRLNIKYWPREDDNIYILVCLWFFPLSLSLPIHCPWLLHVSNLLGELNTEHASQQGTVYNLAFRFVMVAVALFRLYYVILLSLLIVNMYYLFHVNCSLGLLADGQTEDGLIIVAGGYHCVGSH